MTPRPLDEVIEQAIRPALALLPEPMTSDRAIVMLLAIGLQESRFAHRVQVGGPARGYWQFEDGGGLRGVLEHVSSAPHASIVAGALGYHPPGRRFLFEALAHNDILAAAFARLLLYTDYHPLPAVTDTAGAFTYYLRNWRPGAWARGTPAQRAALRMKWGDNHRQAREAVVP